MQDETLGITEQKNYELPWNAGMLTHKKNLLKIEVLQMETV